MPDPESRFQQLVAKLKERDYRLTPQRLALLRLIASSDGHPSASNLHQQIKAQFPTTSPATVYKTLTLLKELGQVLELGFANDDNRYDGSRPYPHPHLVCVACRKIMDPQVSLAHDLTQEVVALTGYQVIGHRLDFYGLCPDCQNRAGREEQGSDDAHDYGAAQQFAQRKE
jgi:Fur family transcriptional regulator, peroxide stress response regulator